MHTTREQGKAQVVHGETNRTLEQSKKIVDLLLQLLLGSS